MNNFNITLIILTVIFFICLAWQMQSDAPIVGMYCDADACYRNGFKIDMQGNYYE